MNKSLMFPLNLQFFSQPDDMGNGGGTTEETQTQTQTQNTGESRDQNGHGSHNADRQHEGDAPQEKPNENFIPKSRFDEVNTKYKELKEQLDALNKEKEQAELEDKKKKGEFEDLYNETSQELENVKVQHQQASDRVTALEGIIQNLVDAELEAVPEDMRDLVPENFTPEQKLSWITNAKKKGLFGAAQNTKENEELGSATNDQQQQVDTSKMSITQLLRSAYGK